MAKKLIKYGKFLVSVALIFCLVLPSYAALSNTDGSSFVTKAEFDSALADFNSRLTTFEAGINSKIDSQVSSYLDRNGIWKGKKFTIVTGSINAPTPVAMGYSTSASIDKITESAWCKLYTVDKAGLSVLRAYYYSTLGNDASAWWGYILKCRDATKNLFDDALNVSIIFSLAENETAANIKYVWTLYNGNAHPNAYASAQWNERFKLTFPWPASKSFINIYYFLNAGDTIYAKFKADARSGFNNDYCDNRAGGGVIGFDEVQVY